MRKSLWIIFSMIFVLAIATLYLKLSSEPHLSNEEQIQALLAEGETAIESRNVRQAMSLVSADYKDSIGFTYPTLRIEVMQAFRSADAFDVILGHPKIHISGNSAVVNLDVSVAAIRAGERQNVFSSPVSLKLRLERQTRYFFFHTPKWRIISISIEGAFVPGF